MNHEHHGNCCASPQPILEHHEAHVHNIAERLGSLCCQGACNHPEHMNIPNVLLRKMTEQLQTEEDDDEIDEHGLKKKKAKYNLGFAISKI